MPLFHIRATSPYTSTNNSTYQTYILKTHTNMKVNSMMWKCMLLRNKVVPYTCNYSFSINSKLSLLL